MLYYETIDKSTLELLAKLQQIELFSDLRLVGGTSLALQIGHRISIDIDLFGKIEDDTLEINSELNKLGQVTQLRESKNIHIYLIDGVKVDIVNYSYPWLEKVLVEDDLQLAHKLDIAAMKIAAITGRGSKKDFIDIYFLLQEFSLETILKAYQQKYHDGSVFMAIKSLVYFEDADQDEMPVMLDPIAWDDIKKSILVTHKGFINKTSH